MKVLAIGLACLIAGGLAAPVQEQAQNSQIQPHAPHEAPVANPMTLAERQEEPDFEDSPEGFEEEGGEEDGEELDTEMMDQDSNIDLEALQEMVTQVQQGVQEAKQAMEQNNGNPEAMKQALAAPVSRIEQATTTGVNRLALPGLGDLSDLTGNKAGKGKGKHDDDDGDDDNQVAVGNCNVNQKQVCCNGLLGCTVIPIIPIIPILSGSNNGCQGESYCCETDAKAGAGVDISLLPCAKLA